MALAILAVPQVIDRPVSTHFARIDAATDAAELAAEPRIDIAVRIARSSLYLEVGDVRGWPTVQRLMDNHRLRDDHRELARACLNWAQELIGLGYVDRAQELLTRAEQCLAQAEDPRLTGVVGLVAVMIDIAVGQVDRLTERVRRLLPELSDFAAAGLEAQFLLASVLTRRGDILQAEPYLRQVVEVAERTGAVQPLVPARALLARLALDTEDPAAAVEQAGAAIAAVRAKGVWAWARDSALAMVDALCALGRQPDACGVIDEFAAGLGGSDAPFARARIAECRAVLSHAQGNPDADGQAEQARADLATLGLRYDAAHVAARLGCWRCERGDGRGPGLLEDALRLFDGLGAGRDVARVCRQMRGYAVPVPYPWRGGRETYGRRLSPREQEVSVLAAAGHTNDRIAAQLCLSRRTVESHVASALRKLGGRSRRDLAGLLAATGPGPAPGPAPGPVSDQASKPVTVG